MNLKMQLMLLVSVPAVVQTSGQNSDELLTPQWLRPYQGFHDQWRGTDGLRIIFYNCENLFDPGDDSLTADGEFTPEGLREWSHYRFRKKVQNISRVILASGGWEAPDLVGLCEVENRWVLEQLTASPALSAFDYDILHQDGFDPRGIDVALLYRTSKFEPLSVSWIPLVYPEDTTPRTRDILYASGVACGADTLHVFVNHWPSRFGGYSATVPKRMLAARLLRQMTDSIMLVDSAAAIVLMGDFNDETEQESISEGLGAMDDIIQDRDGYLVDVTYLYSRNSGFGSHKSMGSWGLLDHFIISAALLNRDAALYQAPGASGIFTAGFLLEEDRRNLGMKTYRTYQGPHYHGGFSDHLPIWLDLQCRPEKR